MITAIRCKSSANQIQKEGEEKNTLKRKEEKAKKEKKKKKKINKKVNNKNQKNKKKKKKKKEAISYTCLFTPHQSWHWLSVYFAKSNNTVTVIFSYN